MEKVYVKANEEAKEKLAILVLLAAVLLGIAAEWMQKQESHFKENRLIRNEPGEGDYQESLNYIEEDSGEKGQIVLNLQERTLTTAEWKEILPEAEKKQKKYFETGSRQTMSVDRWFYANVLKMVSFLWNGS